MLGLHDLDIAEIIDGEKSGKCKFLGYSDEDKWLTSLMAGHTEGRYEKPSRKPPMTPVQPRAGTSSSEGEE